MVMWEDIFGRKNNSDRPDDAQQNKINIKRVPHASNEMRQKGDRSMTQHYGSYPAEINLSRHAKTRGQQRGVRKSTIDFILDHADRSLHVGKGLTAISISRKNQRRLFRKGIDSRVIERADSVAVLLAPDNNDVVTVMRLHGRTARYYHKQHPTRSTKRPAPVPTYVA